MSSEKSPWDAWQDPPRQRRVRSASTLDSSVVLLCCVISLIALTIAAFILVQRGAFAVGAPAVALPSAVVVSSSLSQAKIELAATTEISPTATQEPVVATAVFKTAVANEAANLVQQTATSAAQQTAYADGTAAAQQATEAAVRETAGALASAIEGTAGAAVVATLTAIRELDTPVPAQTSAPRSTATPTTVPREVITGEQRWRRGDKPRLITKDLVVAAGARLVIEAGADVQVGPGCAIYVEGGGTLQIQGRPEAPVHLGARRPDYPSWGGIYGSAGSTILIQHAEIRGAGAGGTTLLSDDGTVTIQRSRFEGNGGQIRVQNSVFEMSDTIITGNEVPYGAVIEANYAFGGQITLRNNAVYSNIQQEGVAGVRITNDSQSLPLTLHVQGNRISTTSLSDNFLLVTNSVVSGEVTCNTLAGGSQGMNLRTQTKQLPPFPLQVHDNSFEGHTPPIVPDYLREGIGRGATSEVVISMRRNWWGDASGPYHPETNQLGRGDAVGDNIDYADWLIQPPACLLGQ